AATAATSGTDRRAAATSGPWATRNARESTLRRRRTASAAPPPRVPAPTPMRRIGPRGRFPDTMPDDARGTWRPPDVHGERRESEVLPYHMDAGVNRSCVE